MDRHHYQRMADGRSHSRSRRKSRRQRKSRRRRTQFHQPERMAEAASRRLRASASIRALEDHGRRAPYVALEAALGEKGYYVTDNAGGGDCFFHALGLALLDTGYGLTVTDLRDILAWAVTPDTLDTYMAVKAVLDSGDTSDAGFAHDYAWLRPVADMASLSAAIQGPSYWADDTAVVLLGEALGLAVVILEAAGGTVRTLCYTSDESDADGDLDDLRRYVLVNRVGQHFRIVDHNGTRLFTRETLPPGVRRHMTSHAVCARLINAGAVERNR